MFREKDIVRESEEIEDLIAKKLNYIAVIIGRIVGSSDDVKLVSDVFKEYFGFTVQPRYRRGRIVCEYKYKVGKWKLDNGSIRKVYTNERSPEIEKWAKNVVRFVHKPCDLVEEVVFRAEETPLRGSGVSWSIELLDSKEVKNFIINSYKFSVSERVNRVVRCSVEIIFSDVLKLEK